MSRLTATFQGQLFHRRLASPGSYVPTMHCPPVRAMGLSSIPTTRFVAHLFVSAFDFREGRSYLAAYPVAVSQQSIGAAPAGRSRRRSRFVGAPRLGVGCR